MQPDSIDFDSSIIQHPIYQSQVSTSMRFRQPCNSQKKKRNTRRNIHNKSAEPNSVCFIFFRPRCWAQLLYHRLPKFRYGNKYTGKEMELSKTWGIPTKDVCGMWKFTNKLIFLHWDLNCIQKPNECDLEYSSC